MRQDRNRPPGSGQRGAAGRGRERAPRRRNRPGAGVGGRHAVYSRACDAAVYHYRDNTGLEVDAVVEDRRGDWCAFEVKLGTGQIDAAAGTLLMLRDRVDAEKSAPPRALGVIVSSGYGYRRKDGVAVIPVAALGP